MESLSKSIPHIPEARTLSDTYRRIRQRFLLSIYDNDPNEFQGTFGYYGLKCHDLIGESETKTQLL